MPNFKRIGGGPWKSPDDLTWNDPGAMSGSVDGGGLFEVKSNQIKSEVNEIRIGFKV